MLHTDDSEMLFDAKRPVILNGIDEGMAEDLLDRIVHVVQPVIEKYRTEAEINAEFDLVAPAVLGALLDAAACALANVDRVTLSETAQKMIRFADFTKWVVAAEPALGWEPGTFVKSYLSNRANAASEALEQSPIGPAVVALMTHCPDGVWGGSATELLMALEERHTDERTKRHKTWPKSGNEMASKLHRLAPVLRKSGIDVRTKRTNVCRKITLKRLWEVAATSSPASPRHQDVDDDLPF